MDRQSLSKGISVCYLEIEAGCLLRQLLMIIGRIELAVNLTDRVAIVTGAGKGIGRACALDLARRGVSVIVNNRHKNKALPSTADTVVEEILADGGTASANHLSIEDSGSGSALVEQALDTYGQLDIVINSAGIALNRTATKTTAVELQHIMDINFFAAATLTQASVPALRQSDSGRLLHCISSAALYSGHGLAAYAASKAALWAYMRACSEENKKSGVCINALAPFATTQMTVDHIPEEMREVLSPDAVVPMATWLVSPKCDISGETIVTAAGKARLARSIETGSATFADIDEAGMAIKHVMKSSETRHFEFANQAFFDIISE